MSAMWFDSNAPEMTTVEHCMHLTKFCELIVCKCMWYSSGEFNHNKATMSQIYESWSLHCSNSMCDAKLSNTFFVKYKSKSWKAGRAGVAAAKVETRWL